MTDYHKRTMEQQQQQQRHLLFVLQFVVWFVGMGVGAGASVGRGGGGGGGECRPVAVPMCGAMPWNLTRLPNLVRQTDPEHVAASVAKYEPLVAANCDEHLAFFLCAMYSPVCSETGRRLVRPCRRVCQRARRGCQTLAANYSITWPQALDCDRLPVQDKGECIEPGSMVAAFVGGKRSRWRTTGRRVADCRCKRSRKLGRNVYTARKFHFVVKGTFLSIQGVPGGPSVITARVEQVLKYTKVQIPTTTVRTLWAGRGCICPRLDTNQTYMFLGFEDSRNKRLLFDKNSMAMPWKPSWPETIKKWELRIQRRRRRRFKKKEFMKKSERLTKKALISDDRRQHRKRHKDRGRHRNTRLPDETAARRRVG